jgi:transposase
VSFAAPFAHRAIQNFPQAEEIVKRSDDMNGFVVLPRRWVAERTFSWFGRNRRLAKDFENLAETLPTFVALASIQLALRRLARA